ncbi:serine/threonine protein phosphatase 2A 57 kDa regulatory subunit B' beta isoform-like [Prosopis cineraria]|uniref:serine/threonine protein phosphatase 2A 57 kDa regulatory subunit B' beta isoform-like n=1 Tax=Prosopis cineraria TaxID=364024 RepID=UPI00240FA968|nr:serine/threonine protein phosphatase 2A 57 kDa regulatory subunit B' beta isoform-like [Prosopis cineraria]
MGSHKTLASLQNLFEQDNVVFPNNGIIASSCSPGDEEILSVISYCNFVFTFTDPSESPSQQDFKRLHLTRLLTIIKSSKKPLPEKFISPLLSMVSLNLFRPLPSSCTSDFPEEDDPASAFTPAWSHLQIVYEILLRLVTTTELNVLRNHIDRSFLLKLLTLFHSEDRRERENLKNVYHKMYTKLTSERSFMRKSMNDVLLNYVFETQKNCGIGELLEIWGTIINGFTVPLKDEHKLFLMRVLIPLHKPKGVQMYHRQLAYCMVQFVQKEPMLGGVVVRGLLKYWPVTNCQKELLLIGELEDLVDNLDPDQYRKLALPLCAQIIKCINSWNSQVAERALYVWNNEQFVKMVSTAMGEVFPVIVEGIEKNLKWHWSKNVRQLTVSVKVMLEDMDPVLYSRSLQDLKAIELVAHEEDIKRKQRWEKIELLATQNQFISPRPCICVSN